MILAIGAVALWGTVLAVFLWEFNTVDDELLAGGSQLEVLEVVRDRLVQLYAMVAVNTLLVLVVVTPWTLESLVHGVRRVVQGVRVLRG